MEQLEQAKKERDDALKQIRDIHDEACRENAKRNREINEFRVQKGHTKAKFDQLEACVQSLNRSNTDFMRRQVSLEEAKTEIQAEIKKSQAMVQRLEKEVQMAKQPTESMREEVAKMRSRLSEVIKTKLVLQNEVAAARQRENQLREDLRLKMEAKETSQFPRSCLQFDMTAEEPGIEKRLDSDDDASGAEADEFDLEFTYEDATDLASYFPIARVASMGKRPSNKVQPEMTTTEFDRSCKRSFWSCRVKRKTHLLSPRKPLRSRGWTSKNSRRSLANWNKPRKNYPWAASRSHRNHQMLMFRSNQKLQKRRNLSLKAPPKW